MGRNQHFQGGMTGTGDVHAATSLQQNVPSAFQPAGVLSLAEVLTNANGSSAETFDRDSPMDAMQAKNIEGMGSNSTAMNV
jgi:hypothetical protein